MCRFASGNAASRRLDLDARSEKVCIRRLVRPITDGIITDLDFGTVVGYHWIRQINSDKFCFIRFVFVCLGFNGTFSTNRLYRAISVG